MMSPMRTVLDYVQRHHVGLLALLLLFGGGTAYAAKVHLPKNSVASKQVKNGSLQGKDLKDRTVTGADVADGSLTGTDLADGTVGAKDLASTAVPVTRAVMVSDDPGGSPTVVFSDPAAGTIVFGCGPGPSDMNMLGTLPISAQPGSVRITAHDLTDDVPVGASTITTTNVGPNPISAGFNGAATVPQGTLFFDSATKRMTLDWDLSGCVLRGVLVIQDKAAQPSLTSLAKGTPRAPTCVEVGAAYCVRR